MNNPWLEIPSDDYENHMSEIGQSQILNQLIEKHLNQYKPKKFALLGCSTGNGLEHIDSRITKTTYVIDINPKYLEITYHKFHKTLNLKPYNIDIQNTALDFMDVELFFIGLVLEYVDPLKSLKNIITTLAKNAILSLVIQKNEKTTFVTSTKYKSLEKLSKISNQVNEDNISSFLLQNGFELINRDVIVLNKNKSFIYFNYQLL